MKTQKWDEDNIKDQKGRIAIVTGSSSGIGYETARVLAEKNASVIIAVRNMEKGNSALKRIKENQKSADMEVMELDLADLQSIKRFAENFKAKYSKLDLLINNAGVMMPPYSKTKDDFELQMGTNHLGHFALTGHLIDLLKNTDGARIVNVSSMAHKGGKIDFEDLNWEKRKYKSMKSYGDSKIANLYFTRELADKLREVDSKTIVAASHPGWTATDLQRHVGLFEFFNGFFAQKIPMGALPTLYAALAEEVISGEYFGPSGFMEIKGYPKKTEPNKLAKDKSISKKLWDVSEKLTGVQYSI